MNRHPAFAQHRSFDAPQFVVMIDYGRLGFESFSNPEMTRAGIVLDIISGQINRVVSVVEFNPVEHSSSDITDSIREEVERALAMRQAAE